MKRLRYNSLDVKKRGLSPLDAASLVHMNQFWWCICTMHQFLVLALRCDVSVSSWFYMCFYGAFVQEQILLWFIWKRTFVRAALVWDAYVYSCCRSKCVDTAACRFQLTQCRNDSVLLCITFSSYTKKNLSSCLMFKNRFLQQKGIRSS